MSNETLAEKIAHRLRRAILRGDLAPGAPVKERDLAADMGVSRTPIREATRILAKEGLIELRPARSPIVSTSDYEEVFDKTEVLIALEKFAAELACKNADKAEIDKLADIVAYIAENYDEIDPLDMFEVDMSFHAGIAAASGNKALTDTHSAFLRQLWRVRYLVASDRRNRERVVDQHTRILDALRARDAQAARGAIDNHLWRLAEDIRDVIEKEAAEKMAAAD